ncbi:MAG: signal peptidase I [Gammaproteobacteria bacterium]
MDATSFWILAITLGLGLYLLIDDLVLSTGRKAQAVGPYVAPKSIRILRWVLLVLAVLTVRVLAQRNALDFSLILVLATAATGLIWLVDAVWLKPKRRALADSLGKPETDTAFAQPLSAEYAKSFFPVILIVLVIRSFLFEPYRIPSDSMMPTLLDGDFIFVNKFAYGLRLPVVHTKILSIGEPKRGDVIVFRLPTDPSTNYIKRLIGLPGDHIQVKGRRLYVNGELIPLQMNGRYQGPRNTGLHANAEIGTEFLDGVEHAVLYIPGRRAEDFEAVVPAGQYFFMGDNRDNSRDSRYPEVGFVPARNIVGKAVRIWLNWDPPAAPIWDRIGAPIR